MSEYKSWQLFAREYKDQTESVIIQWKECDASHLEITFHRKRSISKLATSDPVQSVFQVMVSH